MNILVLSHRLPFPPNKGEKIRTFYQIKELTEAGHSVTVFSPFGDGSDVQNNQQFNKVRNVKSVQFGLANKLIRLAKGLLIGESLSAANFYSKDLQQALEHSLAMSEFDVVLCTSSAMAKYILCSRAFNNVEKKPLLFMDFMDLDSDKWIQYSDKSQFPMNILYRREAKLVSKLEHISQNNFDYCYFISQAEVDLFAKNVMDPSNVHVLGNGLNMDEFYPPETKNKVNSNAPVFIFTGVMDYKPNVDAVLWFVENCWNALLERYTEAKFIIAGMNPNEQILALENTKGIEVTGFVDDILPYYHKANFFVAPFRLARGVQNKVLQGFACGIPVITTPMGAEGIPCRDGEHLLLANTAEQFLAQIDRLISDPVMAEGLSIKALQLIEQEFSWQGKLKPLMDAIQ